MGIDSVRDNGLVYHPNFNGIFSMQPGAGGSGGLQDGGQSQQQDSDYLVKLQSILQSSGNYLEDPRLLQMY